jgi:hypothetical protein
MPREVRGRGISPRGQIDHLDCAIAADVAQLARAPLS